MTTSVTVASGYSERRCLICGSPFAPAYAAQVTCGTACRERRRKNTKSESARAARARHAAMVTGLKAEVERLRVEVAQLQEALKQARDATPATDKAEVASLKADLDATRKEMDAVKKELALRLVERDASENALKKLRAELAESNAALEQAQGTPRHATTAAGKQLQECKRMHLTAFTLPCGLREECFTPLCERVPAGREKPASSSAWRKFK